MALDPGAHPIVLTGLATFFFGFGAGALLNCYLIAVKSPLIAQLRGSLDYKSSIVGDRLLLPAVNMLVVSSLLPHRALLAAETIVPALLLGLAVTVYFHVVQAVRGLVNWAMPAPWRWNLLGAWHAAYMFAVSSLLSLFYVVLAVAVHGHEGGVARDGVLVTLGLAAFCALLRLDYATVSISALVPQAIVRRFR